MGHFRSIWGHLRLNFAIRDSQIFDFSKSVRNRPENTPKITPKPSQIRPKIFDFLDFFGPKFSDFFWWIFNGFLMDLLFWGGPGVSLLGCGSCMEPTPGPRGSSSSRRVQTTEIRVQTTEISPKYPYTSPKYPYIRPQNPYIRPQEYIYIYIYFFFCYIFPNDHIEDKAGRHLMQLMVWEDWQLRCQK